MKTLATLVMSLTVAACGGSDSETTTVTMTKSLGSVQCTGGGTTLAALQTQLSNAGVQVLAASCGTDGLSHPAVCGASDGAIAIIDVPASQQGQAEALSFSSISVVPGAAKAACK